jgi:hypothetical protein
MTEVEFENGDYGERAVLRSACSERIVAQIFSRRCPELEINHGKGWRGQDVSFLAAFPWLQSLKIIDLKIKSVEAIHQLHQLRALEVTTYCGTPVRFSAFPKLEDCGLEWRPKSESLFDCTTLKKLFVNSYSGGNLMAFSRLTNLESLAILNAPIETVEGIASLRKLRILRLANLKKLRSLDGLQFLSMLEELEVHTCPRIASINEVGALENLRKLHLNNDGKLDSLKPLNSIEQLESVLFYESTNIVDGDLSPLMRQKNLMRVSFQNRRHYSHKREDFGVAYTT